MGRIRNLDLAQRIVIVIGWGLALTFFGEWVATLHGYSYGFASIVDNCVPSKTRQCISIGSPPPTQPVYTGLHPWAVMLVWVGLAVVGTVGAVWVLRSPGAATQVVDAEQLGA
ncbi:MAG: hypothetical protein ACYDA2_04170 [Acidimicrobiales bacterium]